MKLSRGAAIRSIADELGVNKNTVLLYRKVAKADPMPLRKLIALEDSELLQRFNGGCSTYYDNRFEEVWSILADSKERLSVHGEVKRLWKIYRHDVPKGYSLSQFQYHANRFQEVASAVRNSSFLPGHGMEIHIVKTGLSYLDINSGESINPFLFFAVLPFSGMGTMTCMPSHDIEHFFSAFNSTLSKFGGVPRTITLCNVKSPRKTDRYDPSFTDILSELSEYYKCTFTKQPDSPEIASGNIAHYLQILPKLGAQVFNSLEELECALGESVRHQTLKRSPGHDYSRMECFMAIEKTSLSPLPESSPEYFHRVLLKVAPNGFVTFGKELNSYSVPCDLIGEKVEIRFSPTSVNIYYNDCFIYSHLRSHGHNTHIYDKEHLLPEGTGFYSARQCIPRAYSVCSEFGQLIERIFAGGQPEPVYFRTIQAYFQLQQKTEPLLFREACGIAVRQGSTRYQYLKSLIDSKCRGF